MAFSLQHVHDCGGVFSDGWARFWVRSLAFMAVTAPSVLHSAKKASTIVVSATHVQVLDNLLATLNG